METEVSVLKLTSELLLSESCFSRKHIIFIDKLNLLFFLSESIWSEYSLWLWFCFGVICIMPETLWMMAVWGGEDKLTIVPFHRISNMCIHRRGRLLIIKGWHKQTLGPSPVILRLISTLFFKCGNPPISLVFPVLLNKSRIWFMKYLIQRSLTINSAYEAKLRW